ncbi:MAG: cupin domain-containing protein [Ignavibacteriaceae bacterium]|nr:cupin domain-containing protein [Ignavibacteriaceae bacterium]
MNSHKFILQTKPFVVPTTDNKLIEEYFGKASIDAGDFSFAHMIAPPKWSEPFQTPEFDELTYVFSGKKMIEVDNLKIILEKNQSIFIKKGSRVRYSNPFDESCEYISLCIPAFKIDKVNRENV